MYQGRRSPTIPRATSSRPFAARSRATFLLVIASLTLLFPPLAWASHPAAGTPYGMGFPRLGMWWPSAYRQSPADVARYDWVALDNGWIESGAIDALRSLNPTQTRLASTDIAGIPFNANEPADGVRNRELAGLPAAWLLTQCGSTLTGAIDAATTRIPVASLSQGGVALFRAGDVVVVDNELMSVQSVDAVQPALTVRRGVVHPAAAHSAGARIAATISTWPGSLLMDVSTFCPSRTVDNRVGSETWRSYRARVDAAMLNDARWDGLLVDRADGDESWVVHDGHARSIDPSRSNQIPTDEYAAFDAEYNAGLGQYVSALRGRVGNDRLLYTNWGFPYYDLLNGNNLEGFPKADGSSYGALWTQSVFGARPKVGAYLDWLSHARQPNLTMIQTYQDDSAPSPSGSGAYANPVAAPGFVPDYRKMRFGLTTALLGDGFFSYEINTNGHGSLGLLWFDEYDNSGQGRGYLGQPTAPASRAVPPLATPNLVRNGVLHSATDFSAWDLWVDPRTDAAATAQWDAAEPSGSGSARITVQRAAPELWDVEFSPQSLSAVTAGQVYTLQFNARADTTRTVYATVQRNAPPWNMWLEFEEFEIGPAWRTVEIPAVSRGSDPAARLHVSVGDKTGNVWIGDVSLRAGDRNVWRRDFTGGTSVCNATARPVTVQLGGVYRRIAGTQVPSVNTGAQCTVVDVGALDGVILLADSTPVSANSALGVAPRARSSAIVADRAAASAAGLMRTWQRTARRSHGSRRRTALRVAGYWKAARDAERRAASYCRTAANAGDRGETARMRSLLATAETYARRGVSAATRARRLKRSAAATRALAACNRAVVSIRGTRVTLQ